MDTISPLLKFHVASEDCRKHVDLSNGLILSLFHIYIYIYIYIIRGENPKSKSI